MFSRIAGNYSSVYTVNYGNKQLQPVSFRGDISKTDTIELSQNGQKGVSTGTKVTIGTGIALTLAIGADFIFCKGKHVKNLLDKLKGNKYKPKVKTEVEQEVKQEKINVINSTVKEEPLVKSETQTIGYVQNNVIDLDNVKIKECVLDKQLNSISAEQLAGINDPRIITVLDECKNLTFDSPNLCLLKDHYDKFLDKYGNSNIFDLGFRYAIVANNTAKIKGSGALINEIPKLFEGIPENELVQKLDILPLFLSKKGASKFTLSGKIFEAKYIGGGKYSDCYLICDEAGNKVCFKISKDVYSNPGGHGNYKEFAIAQEAYKAGVVDVPKLYMGNPVGKYVNNNCRQGAWQVTEYIDKDYPEPQEGLKLRNWLNTKGLEHCDINAGTILNNYFVDLGGIRESVFFTDRVVGDFSWLPKVYNSGKDAEFILNSVKK